MACIKCGVVCVYGVVCMCGLCMWCDMYVCVEWCMFLWYVEVTFGIHEGECGVWCMFYVLGITCVVNVFHVVYVISCMW